jgi:putative Ca2+/H+ antiporter (TMEM165/GDT1 family)
MINLAIVGLVFGVIFLAELPDKSQFATLFLSMRYRGRYVWAGAAAAFLLHVVIAVTAAQALSLLSHRVLDVVVAALFGFGAWLLLLHPTDAKETMGSKEVKRAAKAKIPQNFAKVFATTFGIIFIGEWGDVSQIATASYAAHYYHDILSVGVGAVLALWTASAVAILAGAKVLKRIPGRAVQRVAGVLFLVFAVAATIQAL